MLRSLSLMEKCPVDAYEFLFSDLPVEMEKKKIELDYTLEMIENFLCGAIDTTRKFHIRSYIKSVKDNETMAKSRGAKKSVYIYETDNDADPNCKSGISSLVLQDTRDEYQEYEDNVELAYTVSKMKARREDYVKIFGCDIITTMKQALRGIPSAVASLKELCTVDAEMAEMVQIVLASGISLEELF